MLPWRRFHLEPVFGDEALGWLALAGVALALAAIGLFGLRYGSSLGSVPAWKRLLLGMVQAMIVFVLTIGLLRPSCVRTDSRRQTAEIVFGIDRTRSMTLPDRTGSADRWSALKGSLEDVRPELERLSRRFEMKFVAYDDDLEVLPQEKGFPVLPDAPDGSQSDVASPLYDALLRERGRRPLAYFWLGDGRQTVPSPRISLDQVAQQLARDGRPLYTVAYGEPGESTKTRDVSVENLPAEYFSFAKNDLSIEAAVRALGYDGKDIPVELEIRNEATGEVTKQPFATVTARPDQPDSTYPVSKIITPAEPGRYVLTVRVPQQPEERIVKNNELSAFLTVREGGLRVAYIEGELRTEQKFLRRTLESSRDLEVEYVYLDQRKRDQWPVDLTSLFSDPSYDVFILGDVDSTALHQKGRHEATLEALRSAVDRGKGLLAIGGYHAFDPGGYARTPLETVYPVRMDAFAKQDFDAPPVATFHLPGPIELQPVEPSFVTRLSDSDNAAVWSKLPPLLGANKFGALKPAARVLLASQAGDPMLVASEYGRGRVLCFAGDSTWQWPLQGYDDQYRRFWRQIALWLARKEDADQEELWISLPSRRVAQGSVVDFRAGVRDALGESLDNVSLRAEVVPPEGPSESVELRRDRESLAGQVVRTSAPGEYRLRVTAKAGDRELAPVETSFLVFDHDVELAADAADPEALARLADFTREAGGRAIEPRELKPLLRELLARPIETEIEVETTWRLGDGWPDAWIMFLALFGLLSIDWTLRRAWRLP